jgi:hypothetical protein
MFGNNSLPYVNVGAIYEVFSSRTYESVRTDPSSNTFDSTTVIIGAKIGELQLQTGFGSVLKHEGFIAGCEWIGISQPVFNVSEYFTSDKAINSSEVEKVRKTSRSFANSWSLRMFNSFIGLSF